ncbi:hypothetical protein XBJ1_0642 [Xenorhabdus bovienii SS-2004]|uniref:Uncharacterized protein n=1 Tax=Xenorhabdus bovienii (strain SS-2004) TaxID=406818 RepID=D3UZE0_XENBS|nr:hypothetical protein XBJ1_0642 [Xenorhabdus bovienii SS-2004]
MFCNLVFYEDDYLIGLPQGYQGDDANLVINCDPDNYPYSPIRGSRGY